MLYISRRIGNFSYGVVDTEDGVEEKVRHKDLVDLSQDYRIKIEGFNPATEEIRVYQPADTMSQLQLKTKMLRHVEVCVYRNMITSIRWKRDEVKQPVKLRLSDYAKVCADKILAENQFSGCHKLTLVFDGSLEFQADAFWLGRDMSQSFAGVSGYGVLFDLRELKRDNMAWLVYRVLWDDARGKVPAVEETILDDVGRKNAMMQFLKEDEYRSWNDILSGNHPTWK